MLESSKVPALTRAIDILNLIARIGPCSAATIIDTLGIPKSTAYLLLNELRRQRFLSLDHQENFCLWTRLVELSGIGIYPEIKAPWFHHQEGKDIAAKTLEVLKKYGYTGKDDKVYLQCFDADELKRIKNELEPKMGMDLNLVQLIAYTDWNETQQKQPDGSWVNYNYDWMFKPGAMKQVAEYADGIGPDYHMLIEETSQPGNIKLTGMVQDAQQNKLVVHPYTVRSDKLPEYTTDVNQLYDVLYNKAGVNGLFTDFPDKAVKFLNKE